MHALHSENKRLLLKLLTEEPAYASRNRSLTLLEHQQSAALALFLTHATLATPELNRTNVAAILKGELPWPRTDDETPFKGGACSTAFLEEGGFISFPGGWVSVHCRAPRNTHEYDQSIREILSATELLKAISQGRHGYVRPHFTMDEASLSTRLSESLGQMALEHLLPGAVRQEGRVSVTSEQRFSQLSSTCLWQSLMKIHPPENAFRYWMRGVRVQSPTLVPVDFALLSDDEASQFLNQVGQHISTAPECHYSLKTVFRQIVNASDFERLLRPETFHVTLPVCTEGPAESPEITKTASHLPERNAATLDEAYWYPTLNDPADFRTLDEWPQRGLVYDPTGALTWLTEVCINYVLQSGRHPGFTDSMLQKAQERTALRHILLNLLPRRYSRRYTLFLLSKPETCDVALYHLTDHDLLSSLPRMHPVDADLHRVYLDALITEYLRAAKGRPDNGASLLRVALHLADSSGLYNQQKTDSFHFSALMSLLQKLSDESVAELARAFLQIPSEEFDWRIARIRERSIYYLGLWLTERLASADVDEDLLPALGGRIFRFYSRALDECMTQRKRDLESDIFFATLPWQALLSITGVKAILNLSAHFELWRCHLDARDVRSYDTVSSLRQYVQLLMKILTGPLDEQDRSRVWQRLINIVCTYGFGPSEETFCLFSTAMRDSATDLWKAFSLRLNSAPASFFDDFSDRCLEQIPLDSLYILSDHCNISERQQSLLGVILRRQDPESETLGLASLETAFIHACDNNHLELAQGVLSAAEPLLERLRSYEHYYFKEALSRWEIYKYKFTLLSAYQKHRDNPEKFEETLMSIPEPESRVALPGHELARRQARECDQFRRYITAAAYCETRPEKSVCYMEALLAETHSPHYAFTLFEARVRLHAPGSPSAYRFALKAFLTVLSDTPPGEWDKKWVALVLDILMQTGAQQQADDLWRQLTREQHRTRDILLPYARGVIKRGEPHIASQILSDFREFNGLISEKESGLADLLDALSHALPHKMPVIDIIQAMAESGQRDLHQMRKHYATLVSGSFEDYVQITGNGYSKEVFLKNIVSEIASELLLRRKNLQHQRSSAAPGQRQWQVIQEDLINDWFTSLFDKRMAEARIGFRDQKRAGRSASGKQPGESDGLITDSRNKRIAIFEAFRLFSLDIAVITEHLDKIASYDTEALSPVFMVAYCDVADFSKLCEGYLNFITASDYRGYTASGKTVMEDRETSTDNLWLCTEIRQRGAREVMFCHLLLNMRDDAPPAS